MWRSVVGLAAVALIAFVPYLVKGSFAGVVAAAVLLALWVARDMLARNAMARWLTDPRIESAPHASGEWNDLYAAVHRQLRSQRHAAHSLSATAAQFKDAARALPDGMVLLDEQDHILWCNPAAEEHLGIRAADDAGQHFNNFARDPKLVDYLAGGAFGRPLILRGYRGADRVVSIACVPYGAEQKLVLTRDITRWELLDVKRREFVANVSHELRTPLTVVSGFLETLLDGARNLPAPLQRSLSLMDEQAQRMKRLVEDLLTLSRLEDARHPPRETNVDLRALGARVAADARSLSRGRHQIGYDAGTDKALRGAADELASAFGNLVSNAVRYTPDGGRIDIALHERDGALEFSVRDTGEGIAPEHIPRLTERFYRVDRSRSRETGGTGLGLAIVKHVLLRHQAQLAVESEIGKGSTFTVRFPAERTLAPSTIEEPIAA